MTVSHEGGSTPPRFTEEHLASVRRARAYVANADQRGFGSAPSLVMLRDLLAAYDVLSARVAFIAASHGDES